VPPARRKEKEKRIGFTSIQMVHTHTKKNTKDKKNQRGWDIGLDFVVFNLG
jgi:ribosomal protein S15P/S13E